MAQRLLDPRAGFVAALEGAPFPSFPADPLGRIRWAEEAPIRGTGAKTVLIILAHRADKSGKAWPTVESLARWAGASRRTTIEAIRRLEDDGWLTVLRRPRLVSQYWPKPTHEIHCRQCWYAASDDIEFCPSCGWELRVRNLHVGVRNLHP